MSECWSCWRSWTDVETTRSTVYPDYYTCGVTRHSNPFDYECVSKRSRTTHHFLGVHSNSGNDDGNYTWFLLLFHFSTGEGYSLVDLSLYLVTKVFYFLRFCVLNV